MSQYADVLTCMTNVATLAAALTEMGYQPQLNTTAQGFGSQQREAADIVLRKHDLSQRHNGVHLYGDVAFTRAADGRIMATVDDSDEHSLNRCLEPNRSSGEPHWRNAVTRAYTEQHNINVARERGYVFRGREAVTLPDGRREVKLLFGVR